MLGKVKSVVIAFDEVSEMYIKTYVRTNSAKRFAT